MATVSLDTSDLLHGSTGVVSQSMAAFAPKVEQSVRQVASERLRTSTPGGYIDQLSSTWDGQRINVEGGGSSVLIERGSRPHVIESSGPQAFQVGGATVYTTRVNHPGTQPYNILTDGVRRAGRETFG